MTDVEHLLILSYLPQYIRYEPRSSVVVNGGRTAQRQNARMRRNAGMFADDDDFVFYGKGERTPEKIDRDNQATAEKHDAFDLKQFKGALAYLARLEEIIGADAVSEWHQYYLRTYPHSIAHLANCLWHELQKHGLTRDEVEAIRTQEM